MFFWTRKHWKTIFVDCVLVCLRCESVTPYTYIQFGNWNYVGPLLWKRGNKWQSAAHVATVQYHRIWHDFFECIKLYYYPALNPDIYLKKCSVQLLLDFLVLKQRITKMMQTSATSWIFYRMAQQSTHHSAPWTSWAPAPVCPACPPAPAV